MRTALFTIGAAVSALAVATPASAQYFPQPRGYMYQPMQNYGHARAMKSRVDYIQRELRRLAAYRMISRNEFQHLMHNSREIERRLVYNARDGYGLSRREAYDVERRIAWLEREIARDLRDGRRGSYRW